MKAQQYRLIYLLPNLFTAASIFSAVVAITAAAGGEIAQGVGLIFLSLLFDGLDGRVARLTRTSSRFGVEFDSLADIVAFGVAPAMLLYFSVGVEYGRFGVLVAAWYIIFGAIRLARFNVMGSQADPSIFVGLPIPTAAVFLSIWILLAERYGALKSHGWILLLLALATALLMVSHIRYPSFKRVNFSKPMALKLLVGLIVTASLLYLYPAEGVGVLVTLYLLGGVVRAAFNLLRRYGKRNKG